MKLVKSERQLRRVSQGTILQSWDRMGPCPAFIESPAVMIEYDGEEYIVFTTLARVVQVSLEVLEAKQKEKQC